jgi:serine protease
MLTSPYTDYEYAYNYTGKGVRVFVLDTGLDISHEEFGGRARCGWDAYDSDCADVYGHGSHVAGTIGSISYGGAKEVTLIGVKVLGDDGSGTKSTSIAGIDYVIGRKRVSPKIPFVINMSLGGSYSSYLNRAVKSATKRGITVVIAAGNEDGADACNVSPASEPSAITVGSTNYYNEVSLFSNGGSCVDIMAPGSDIDSVSSCDAFSDCSSPVTFSGTSMATPLVAAIAALHLQKKKGLKPDQVWAAIKSDARKGVIDDIWGYTVPDLLLSASSILN